MKHYAIAAVMIHKDVRHLEMNLTQTIIRANNSEEAIGVFKEKRRQENPDFIINAMSYLCMEDYVHEALIV